ncbi:MAG: glycosyltransferase [Alphaproteobacteria bacterium]|jgi:glycosyltransferase involved in cell wall biosynthesis|nr:glycosyltransferase [Alphaproteobacteria bacterium]MDP6812252.1 glycosyltransferase [Alphaproteobacteria bacterium]|tara:strand:+ start:1208 stop:2176 length:969 start_codon:yes stop_codon:yes gene_type:complete
MHLTIGVASQDGMVFIERCLASLVQVRAEIDDISILLVDCISSDGTSEVMRRFAETQPDVEVLRIDGSANLSVVRNVVLDHVADGAVFMCDDDILLSADFVRAALETLESDLADAVCGALTEIGHDENNQPVSRVEDIYGVTANMVIRRSGGLIMIGPRALNAGLRYDEGLRRNEDYDFSFRLSERFTVMRIPISMGIHLTHRYVHKARRGAYYREAYSRPTGILVRKYLGHPVFLWEIAKGDKGVFIGLALQTVIVAGLLSGVYALAVAALLVAGADFIRFLLRGRAGEYVPVRVAAPWYVLWGLLGPPEPRPTFTVKRVI